MAKDKTRGTARQGAADEAPRERRSLGGAAVVIGWVAPGSRLDRILVDFEGSGAGPTVARSAAPLDGPTLARAARERQGAVLAFEDGDPGRPVLLGLLVAPAPSPLLDSVIEETQRRASQRPAKQPGRARAERAERAASSERGESSERGNGSQIEARLDGKRVVLEAREEIVLRCGDASIILRRDGRLVVKGAYVETRATGVNRIKGGAVKIN